VLSFFWPCRSARLDDLDVQTRRIEKVPPEAEDQAQELFRSWLSPNQRTQYERYGHFEVVGSNSGRRYRIGKGFVFNVHELDAFGLVARSWCFTIEGVATGDVNLAQKIALETFESEALAVANRKGMVWR